MPRRLLRILAVTLFAALLFLALFSQWYGTLLQRHHVTLSIEDGGITLWTNPDFERPAQFVFLNNRHYWALRNLVRMPDLSTVGSESSLILPWWILLPAAASASLLLWWLTHQRKQPKAFPVTSHQDPPAQYPAPAGAKSL